MLNKIQNFVFIPMISITVYREISDNKERSVTALVKVTLAEKGSVHSVFFVQT